MGAITRIDIDLSTVDTLQSYIEAGKQLSQMSRHVGFMIGDWVNHGREQFGEQFDLALEQTEIDRKFALKAADVAKAFPAPVRSKALAFEHHKIVSKLPREDALQILTKAEGEHWKPQDVREAVTQRRYETGELFDDDDVDYSLAVIMIHAWNRGTVGAREYFMQLAEEANGGTIDEDATSYEDL